MQCLLFPASRRAPKDTLFCFLRNAGLRKTPFFTSCVTQGPKDTLFYSLRCAGPRKTPFFAPCVAQGSERHPFLLPALRRARKTPFFAPCVAQDSERDPFLLPASRRAPKETLFCSLRCAGLRKTPFFAPCVAQGSERDPFLLHALRRAPKDDAFQAGANKKSVQTVTARTLSSMLSLKSKILMPVASWSGHTCQRSQQPWRHRRLRLPRCRPQSAAYGSSVHRHSPA